MTSHVTANGISIHYALSGPEDGPVVMLSNSLMSNFTMWDPQMAALTERYRVLRYDTRGHGGTEATEGPYTIEQLAADAKALLDALGIDSIHYVGLSLGGFIGQRLAVDHPSLIRSLSLCDTACHMPPESLWNERIEAAETEGIESLVAGTLDRWFTEPFHSSGKDAIDKVRQMIRGTSVQGYVGCARAIRDMNQMDLLAKIAAPTVVIVGENDPATPVAASKVLRDGIAGSSLVVLKNAAHLSNIEQAAAFNAALVGFLSRQET